MKEFTEQGSHYSDTVNMPQTFFQPDSAYSIGKKNFQKVTLNFIILILREL